MKVQSPALEIVVEKENHEPPLERWKQSRDHISKVLDQIEKFSQTKQYRTQNTGFALTLLSGFQKKLSINLKSLIMLREETNASLHEEKICGIAKSRFQSMILSTLEGATVLTGITTLAIEGALDSSDSSDPSLHWGGYACLISAVVLAKIKDNFRARWEKEKNQRAELQKIDSSILTLHLMEFKVNTLYNAAHQKEKRRVLKSTRTKRQAPPSGPQAEEKSQAPLSESSEGKGEEKRESPTAANADCFSYLNALFQQTKH